MVQFLGSNFESMREAPDGVQALMESWLGQVLYASAPQLGFRLIERAKGRPQMERIHLQGVRNNRFVNARVKPAEGGNDNCWIVSIPIPRDVAKDDFFEDLQVAANRVNGWTEGQLEERQMLALHALLRGEPIDLVRVKETAAIEAGFPSLAWLGSALAHLSTRGQFVRSAGAGGNAYEWEKDFDAQARKDWRPPSDFPTAPTDPIVQFIRSLGADGLAATELLGELPSIEEEAGRPRIRIPNDFPLAEDERDAFYLRAENIKLLNTVGVSPAGIQERVWELDLAVYEEVLETMDDLGLISHQSDGSSQPILPALAEPETQPLIAEAPAAKVQILPERDQTLAETQEPEPDVSEIRDRLSAARARRASSIAEHNELQKQYQETVREISEMSGIVGELNKQLKTLNIKLSDLHRTRARLKAGVKSTGREHAEVCKEAKRLSIQLDKLTQASTESTATSLAELLREESLRTGVSLDRLMGKLREKLKSS